MNHFIWLVRREFWENRAIWIMPATIGAALAVAALFGRFEVTVPGHLENRGMAAMALFGLGAVFYAAMAIYSSWYLLDCLYADRKDRSVLFWKSLPISDSAMVLSKVFVALLAIPAVYFAMANLTTFLITAIISLRTSLGGVLWQPRFWLQLQFLWLYAIVTSAIWFLPLSGWLLLASAWARRAVILWAVLPPLAATLAERLFVGSSVLANVISGRLFTGYRQAAFHEPLAHEWSAPAAAVSGDSGGDAAASLDNAWRLFEDLPHFLSNPQTWIGAVVGVALIALAIHLRRRRPEA
jgi:ABC-2 type transport system permease protein